MPRIVGSGVCWLMRSPSTVRIPHSSRCSPSAVTADGSCPLGVTSTSSWSTSLLHFVSKMSHRRCGTRFGTPRSHSITPCERLPRRALSRKKTSRWCSGLSTHGSWQGTPSSGSRCERGSWVIGGRVRETGSWNCTQRPWHGALAWGTSLNCWSRTSRRPTGDCAMQ